GRGDAEREPDEPGHEPRDRQSPQVAPAVIDDEDRRRVGADPHERPVAERDLAGVPGEEVQPEQCDQVDRDERELVDAEVREDERRPDHAHHEGGEPEPAERQLQTPLPHTRLTTVRPKSPAGLTSSTNRSTTSATGSRSSGVTQLTYVPSRLSATP